jgi:hypothetical protein
MTLHTRMAVLEPVPVKELFDWINAELLGAPDAKYKHEELTDFDSELFKATQTGEKDERGVLIGERRWIPNGKWEYSNDPGQGLGAWMWVKYRPDGPLHPKPLYYDSDYDETDEPVYWASDEEDEQEPTLHLSEPAMALEINFDTAYGYGRGEGYGCGDLHAAMIVRIGEWLDARGVGWLWYNEFYGTWHERDDHSYSETNEHGHFRLGDPALGEAALKRTPRAIANSASVVQELGPDGGAEFITRGQ